MVVPLAAVMAALIDFALAWVVLIALMLWYGVAPSTSLVLVLPLTVVLLLAAVGVGVLLAALNVAYRDFRYVVTFLMQIWLFATPSVYMEYPAAGQADAQRAAGVTEHPSETPETPAAHGVFQWNPMTGLIAAFRNALLGRPLPGRMLAVSLAMNAALFCMGCWYFRRVEDSFADVV
jgi:lipopolysaccharide transport system permease protein